MSYLGTYLAHLPKKMSWVDTRHFLHPLLRAQSVFVHAGDILGCDWDQLWSHRVSDSGPFLLPLGISPAPSQPLS